jgi:hypothetical protein
VLSNARVGVAGGPRAAEGDARAGGVRVIDWLADRATPSLLASLLPSDDEAGPRVG